MSAELVNLASLALGAKVLKANDEFFAEKENLLKPQTPIFIADKFTPRGKWMDGWETRRRRTPGFDWCVIKLGLRGVVKKVDVDTSFFTGNYPESCSIEARDGEDWREILPMSALKGGSSNVFEIRGDEAPSRELRLNIFPDGGVARLRVYGDVVPDWKSLKGPVDLAAIVNGGQVLAKSDMYFGHANNMLMPGRAKNMGDGWETKRRRGPGHDWAIIKLGRPGFIEKIEVDTNHFKGNYPDSCMLEGCHAPNAPAGALTGDVPNLAWFEILPQTKLSAHKRHFFTPKTKQGFTHVRMHIYPDGGISRLRLHGRPA
jgi:allantoicase